jgi:hypothetical protein
VQRDQVLGRRPSLVLRNQQRVRDSPVVLLLRVEQHPIVGKLKRILRRNRTSCNFTKAANVQPLEIHDVRLTMNQHERIDCAAMILALAEDRNLDPDELENFIRQRLIQLVKRELPFQVKKISR